MIENMEFDVSIDVSIDSIVKSYAKLPHPSSQARRERREELLPSALRSEPSKPPYEQWVAV